MGSTSPLGLRSYGTELATWISLIKLKVGLLINAAGL